ncbi:hypothetical protein [Tardiphaga sp. 709]|uniref:hypothetical protein n=1 Tax=Tardiphaga sp. 709 TaxID=3076039 RepID=UPI0028EE3DAB|nr:hypothetical protein [Tardiphaga sp. 709]WNV10100.1 hypothetical protein RSO67_02570 [Tardiphaga sp. 709]
MQSAFERAVARGSKVLDARHGKPLRFVPKPKVDNFGKPVGLPDGRQSVDCVGGIVEGRAGFEFLAGDKRNSEFAAQTVNQEKSASIERRYFLDSAPQRGDQLQRLDDDLTPIEAFEIMAVVNDGPSRFAFLLVPAR